MSRCIIFGAGEYDAQTPPEGESLVIAADGGYSRCLAYGFTPDIVIGDFDSLGFVPENANTVRLPVEKDVTDTDAAVTAALERGCAENVYFVGMGGRPDHTLANYALAARLSQKGIRAFLYGGGYVITALTDGTAKLSGVPGKTVSVFAWTEKAEGVTLRGLKYPLENHELTNTFALGVSNSFIETAAEITVARGTLIIMLDRQ